MKKFFLFALATLIVGSASAQTLSNKNAAKVQRSTVNPVQKQKMAPVTKMLDAKALERKFDMPNKKVKPFSLNLNDIKSAERKTLNSSAPKKVGQFANSYNGYSNGSEGSETFVLTPVTLKTDKGNVPGFRNVLPNPFEAAGLSEILVEYSIDADGLITVPAQYVTTLTMQSGAKYDIYINSNTASSTDGSFQLQLAEDGNLTMVTPYLAYYAFNEGEPFSMDGGLGYWSNYNTVKYVKEGESAAPNVTYDSSDAIFYSGLAANGSYFTYQHVLLPAYAPVSYINYTTDPADSWTWNTYKLSSEDDKPVKGELVSSGNSKDYSFVTEGGEVYYGTELIGKNGDLASDPFINADANAIFYAGAIGDNWTFEDGNSPIVSKSNLKYELTGVVKANAEASVKSLILYQGKPAAPLYIEGVNMLIYNFVDLGNFSLTCKLVKATRDAQGRLTLGDVIAESEVNTEDLTPSDWGNTLRATWNNFVVKDEMGFAINLDYMFIQDEFAIVIEGWNNGTFTGLSLADDGPENGLSNTYIVRADENEFSGRYFTFYGNVLAGFDGAAYGYLKTSDDTNVVIPAAGGQASIHIEPMLTNYNKEEKAYSTRLFLDADSEEIPDWLTVGFANEKFEEDEISYDLVFQADALPEGTASRSVNLTFFQEGALIDVTVTQDNTNGVNTVVNTAKVNNHKVHDLSGRQVSGKKGLIVRDGKKFIVK